MRFHSISFPSEWGLKNNLSLISVASQVSIQLVSPASGDFSSVESSLLGGVSIQLVSPASGDGMDYFYLTFEH